MCVCVCICTGFLFLQLGGNRKQKKYTTEDIFAVILRGGSFVGVLFVVVVVVY